MFITILCTKLITVYLLHIILLRSLFEKSLFQFPFNTMCWPTLERRQCRPRLAKDLINLLNSYFPFYRLQFYLKRTNWPINNSSRILNWNHVQRAHEHFYRRLWSSTWTSARKWPCESGRRSTHFVSDAKAPSWQHIYHRITVWSNRDPHRCIANRRG